MHTLKRFVTQNAGRNLRFKFRVGLTGALLLMMAVVVAACSSSDPTATPPPAPADTAVPEVSVTPAVQVADQALVEDTVTVASVVSAGPGWIVIHADNDGAPGPILGYAPVQDGENSDVVVELNLVGLTGTLRAMLHTDAGQLGTFEFPGEDGPVTYGDGIVISPFDLQIAEGDAVDVSLQDFSFSPALLIVRAGATVTWTNNDGNVIHTTTSDDGVWDSGALNGGDAFSFAFDEPGTYRYYCQPHGGPGGEGMSGIIVVVPDATETAAASG
jgi:plastocyanin